MNYALIYLMKYLPLADMVGPDGNSPSRPLMRPPWQVSLLPWILGLLIAGGLLVFFIRSKKKRDKEDKQ